MTPNDALKYAKRLVGKMPIDGADTIYRILDDASKKLWMTAPWRWTIGSLEVTTVINDQQDYTLASPPSDLYYIIQSIITNGEQKNDLRISAELPETSVIKGAPKQVQYITASDKLRLLPVPTAYESGDEPDILTIYKKTHTDIAVGNIDSDGAAGMPDEWFWVYQEIVLMKAYQFTHDTRLGGVTVSVRGPQFTGQMGVVEAAIAEMRMKEKRVLDSLGGELNG